MVGFAGFWTTICAGRAARGLRSPIGAVAGNSVALVVVFILGLEVGSAPVGGSRAANSGICAVDRTLGLDCGLVCKSGGTDAVDASSTGREIGSVVLLVPVEIEGREVTAYADCGLLLKSVCDRAADRTAFADPGTGFVALRLALDVLRLLLSPEG